MQASMSGPRRGSGTARVVRTDDAGAVLRTVRGTLRATWGGGLLLAIAASSDAMPRPGDVVDYRRWPGGILTIERVHSRERRCG